MLKVVAVSCKWLNVRIICQGKGFFQKKSRENVGFHKEGQGKFMLFAKKSGKLLSKGPYRPCIIYHSISMLLRVVKLSIIKMVYFN